MATYPHGANGSFSEEDALFLLSAAGGTSVVACAVGLALVLLRKLSSKLSFRFASYQVAVGLVSGMVYVLEALFLRTVGGAWEFAGAEPALCVVVAYLMQCSLLAKGVATAVLSAHLFALSVCRRDARRLEAGYVVILVAVPLMISAVPLVTGSYTQVAGTWCWIGLEAHYGTVLQTALWYGPAAALVAVECVFLAAIVAVTVYRERVESRETTLLVTRRPSRKSVRLRTVAPLLVYPTLWCALTVLPVACGLYGVIRGNPDGPESELKFALLLVDALCTSAWGVLAGLVLILHVACDVRSDASRQRHTHSLSLSIQDSLDESSTREDYSSGYQHIHNSNAEVGTFPDSETDGLVCK